MARPGRGHCTPSHRHGIPNVIPLPWAPSPTPGEPKTRHSLITPGIPAPPLSGPSADGLPFPGAGYCMAHDTRKRRSNGDEPVSGTIPRLVEVGNCKASAGHHRPHQRGTCRRHPGTETGDQEKPCTPTPKPNSLAVAPLSDAISGLTVSPREAGGDANRDLDRRTTEPPPSLQHNHIGTASRDMEHNCAAE